MDEDPLATTIEGAWARLKTAALNGGITMTKNEEKERRRMFFRGANAAFGNMLYISNCTEPKATRLTNDLAEELINFESAVAEGIS